jgi:hypothetical protein
VSTTDSDADALNWLILQEGDAILFAEEPVAPAPISVFTRYVVTAEPVDNGTWFQIDAERIDDEGAVAPPALTTEMRFAPTLTAVPEPDHVLEGDWEAPPAELELQQLLYDPSGQPPTFVPMLVMRGAVADDSWGRTTPLPMVFQEGTVGFALEDPVTPGVFDTAVAEVAGWYQCSYHGNGSNSSLLDASENWYFNGDIDLRSPKTQAIGTTIAQTGGVCFPNIPADGTAPGFTTYISGAGLVYLNVGDGLTSTFRHYYRPGGVGVMDVTMTAEAVWVKA